MFLDFRKDDKEKDHVLWLWRGDYLNLGTGAEIGIYNDPVIGLWSVPEYRFKMNVNMYNYYGKNDITNVFCWHPYEGQWWATGWNPEMRLTDNTGFVDPNVHNTIMIGCVDFYDLTSGVIQEDMYDAIKETVKQKKKYSKFCIPDSEEKKLWIVWWDDNQHPI